MELDLVEQRRHRWLNTLHTWLLAGGSLALLAVTAYAFGGVSGVVWAVLFGVVSMAMALRVSPRMVLTMYKARPVSPDEFPVGVDIVAELARRAGLPRAPQLYVVPSELMNAFAVGRRDEAVVAITDALARRLTPREFAGVMAHEISHVANEDIKVMAFADMVSRYTSALSTFGFVTLLFNIVGLAGGFEARVPWLAIALMMFAPTIGGLLQMALSRTREFDADLNAVALTGDPDGLASALMKLERAQRRQWEGLVLPGGRIPDPSILRTHPVTEERVARLMALKGEDGEPLPPISGELVRRASSVPRIRMREPLALSLVGDAAPCRDESLHYPEGSPRIRVRRGGVWW